ncbi:MAG: FAD-dependent oxidoreductase [Clostridia bacterium]
MDEMLLSAGVRLYYGQPAVAVETEGRKVQAVIISTKGGLRRIRASMVIDCTGDGDICAWAEPPTSVATLNPGSFSQNCALLFSGCTSREGP